MNGIDRVIHPLPRLSICSVLASTADWTEFAMVRELTGLSDSMVSKHSQVLAEANYLEGHKGAVGRRPRTWFRITRDGGRAYQSHVEALVALSGPPRAVRSP